MTAPEPPAEPDGVSPSSGEPYGPGTVVDVIAEEINETVGMKVSWPRISGIAHRAAARLRREGLLAPSGDTGQARDVLARAHLEFGNSDKAADLFDWQADALRRAGLLTEPSGDTVQAPDVTGLLEQLDGRHCCDARMGHDDERCMSCPDEAWPCPTSEIVRRLRALLGTDTTPEEKR